MGGGGASCLSSEKSSCCSGCGDVAPPLRSPGREPLPPGLGGSAKSRVRVGMVLPVRAAPFLLAKGLTKKSHSPTKAGWWASRRLAYCAMATCFCTGSTCRAAKPWGSCIWALTRATRRMPLFYGARRGQSGRSAEMGLLARSRRGADRLADVPDQGRPRYTHTGCGPRSARYSAAPDRGDPPVCRSLRATADAVDAVRRSERRDAAGAGDPEYILVSAVGGDSVQASE